MLSAQIVTLNDTMGQMQRTIIALAARLPQTEDEAMRGSRRGRDHSGEDGDVDGGLNLMSDKLFGHSPCTKRSGPWRGWAEDFVDFIIMRDDELAEALNTSKEARTPIVSLCDSPRQFGKAKKLYRVVRKLIEHSDARALVVHAADKNIWEVLRALSAKLEMVLDMLPASMRDQIEVSTVMMRCEDITFDDLKTYVLAWVFRHASAPTAIRETTQCRLTP